MPVQGKNRLERFCFTRNRKNALTYYPNAFFEREPVSTSLENALAFAMKFVIAPVGNLLSGFVATMAVKIANENIAFIRE